MLEIGALWAAELLGLMTAEAWPIDEYRESLRDPGS